MRFYYDENGRYRGRSVGPLGWFVTTVLPFMILFGLALAHPVLWLVLGGLVAAAIVTAVILFRRGRRAYDSAQAATQGGGLPGN